MCIFTDNASIHTSYATLNACNEEDINIDMIYNIAYKPMYNGIEYFWLRVKALYRKKISHLRINMQDFVNAEVVQ